MGAGTSTGRANGGAQRARDMRVLVATADFEAVGFNIPVAEFIKAARPRRNTTVLAKLGPDALGASFDREEAVRRLRTQPSSPVAEALLNQRLLAGLGNVSEIGGAVRVRHQPFRQRWRRLTIEQLEQSGRYRPAPAAGQCRSSRRRGSTAMPDAAGRRDGTIRASACGSTAARGFPAVDAARQSTSGNTGPDARLTYWCPDVSDIVIWLALAGGTAAAAAALYGHYYVLPGWLTGPEICRLEDGGCAVLFRSPRSALLGVPNATLGLALYALLAAGLLHARAVLAAPDHDGARRRDERVPRPEPDRQRASVPHLLDRPHLECGAVRDVARSDWPVGVSDLRP